jgi:hypothetical protein
MAALNQTTLSHGLGENTRRMVRLTSTVNIVKGDLLFCDGEAMIVQVTPTAGSDTVVCSRGMCGTRQSDHAIFAPVFTGRPWQFYSRDPQGIPDNPPDANPWINLTTGAIWFAEGETVGPNQGARFWQKQVPTYYTGYWGIPQAPVQAPTS